MSINIKDGMQVQGYGECNEQYIIPENAPAEAYNGELLEIKLEPTDVVSITLCHSCPINGNLFHNDPITCH